MGMLNQIMSTFKNFMKEAKKFNSSTVTRNSFHNPFTNKPLVFTCLQYESLENTVGKEEIEQFLLFPQHFQTEWRTFSYFHQT